MHPGLSHCLFKLTFVVIFPFTLRSTKQSLSFKFSDKYITCNEFLAHRKTLHALPIIIIIIIINFPA
jgi:hypothetical protein